MTEEKHGRASRTTQEQYNILINAVEENPTMKLGKIQITEKKEVDKMWADVTKKLNNCRGPQKTVDQWKRTFIEYKSKIKSKARQNLVECRGTGGGPKMVKPLTDIEERLMGLIGKVTCSGDPSLPEVGLPPSTVQAVSEAFLKEIPVILETAGPSGNTEEKENIPKRKSQKRKVSSKETLSKDVKIYQECSQHLINAVDRTTIALRDVEKSNVQIADAVKSLVRTLRKQRIVI